jgi:hypothetical protein
MKDEKKQRFCFFSSFILHPSSFRLAGECMLALLLAGILAAQPAPVAQGKRYALVVGVSEGPKFAEEDAAELAVVLECARFEVVLLTGRSASRAKIDKHLADLLAKCAPGDLTVVALAGYGARREGALLSLDELYRQLGKAPGVKVLLADACRDTGGLRPPAGVAALFSCSEGEHAADRETDRHGAFFFHVLEGLRGSAKNGRGDVTWDNLTAYVQKHTAREAKGDAPRQTPALVGKLGGEPVVVIRKADALLSHALLGFTYNGERGREEKLGQVLFVLPGGGGERLGLRPGDLVESVNKKEARFVAKPDQVAPGGVLVRATTDGIKKVLHGLKLGERVELVVTRQGTKHTLVGRFASPFSASRDLPRLLEQGEKDVQAAMYLARLYASGTWLVKDEAEAVRWVRKAADRDYAVAQRTLAEAYLYGKGIEKDEAEGVRWYKKAAEQDDAVAQNNLGSLYLNGQGGVKKDPNEAVVWFRKSVAHGESAAQYNLGQMYENGVGLPRNRSEAIRLYRLAAEQGHPRAAAALRRLRAAP